MTTISGYIRRFLTALRDEWELQANASTDWCCTCGGQGAVYVYWGACTLPAIEAPDWQQCEPCHDDPSAHSAWMRGLRHERMVNS
jgi:hypothetical protein